MSATIILIMTSSSTRNTEPRGGRVEVITSVLAPSRMRKFANIAFQSNANIIMSAVHRYGGGATADGQFGGFAQQRRARRGVPGWEQDGLNCSFKPFGA